MHITETPIAGLLIAETTSFRDERGMFTRLFYDEDLASVLENRRILQINHSLTRSVGAVRGMHYQIAPHFEIKMVRCIKGCIWDVAVDLRKGSPTFLQWYARELSPENALMFIIPEGCAHGFQVLEANSELLYLHTAPYSPEAERGLHHNDPTIAINWPLPVTDLSAKDNQFLFLDNNFQGLKI